MVENNSTEMQPDTILYIYYFEGLVAPDYQSSRSEFLGTWIEDGFSFLFFKKPAETPIHELQKTAPHLKLLDTFEMTYEQWQGGKIEPLHLGRFLLQPPWNREELKEGMTEILLDPGVVFGNGLHPTTRDCLEAIDLLFRGPRKPECMLDLGTGTGVLALAAAKLGCNTTIAVDFNYLATQTALNNARLNNIEEHILVANGQAEEFTSIASDLLVANIHYEVMKKIVASKGFVEQKWFILSGLMQSEADKISDQLADLPVIILQRWNTSGNWHTLMGITEVK